MMPSKYRNKRVYECEGCGANPPSCFRPKPRAKCPHCGGKLICFDSKKEHRRWHELKLLEKAGQIRNLERQVAFTFSFFVLRNWQEQGGPEEKRLETDKGTPIKYVADFCYEEEDGYGVNWAVMRKIVEDVKGMRTEAYKIKKALMLAVHGVEIRET